MSSAHLDLSPAPHSCSSQLQDEFQSETQRDRARHRLHAYGNYHQYYSHRQDAVPDARLQLLPLLTGKKVLDLGCNAGKLTLEVVRYRGATQSHGVDIDQHLIEQAHAAAEREYQEASELNGKITFQHADFMQDSYIFEHSAFDVILLLSITKWLHLHHGDVGLRKLFKRLANALPTGGLLVVEPQERDNYRAAVKKNKDLRPMFKTIEMWPPFEDALKATGLTLSNCIEREEGGFSRPLMIWRKD